MKKCGFIYQVKKFNKKDRLCRACGYDSADTYEEARRIAIEKALKLIKLNQNV
jgi:ribosomal protein L37E